MSVVSTVTLQVFLDEDVERINAWLEGHGHGRLVSVGASYGGNKCPQVEVWGGAFNYLREDEFAAFVMGLPWEDPENVVLLINPEEGPTRIWRAADD